MPIALSLALVSTLQSELVIAVRPDREPSLAQALRRVEDQPRARLVLEGGTYRLKEPLRVGPRHAGLTIEAKPGTRPILVGGAELRDWRREGDVFVALVPAEIAQRGSRALTVGASLRPRSRWPETGTLTHENKFDVRWMSTTGGGWERKPTDDELTTMRWREGDLGDWVDPASAEVTVYHMWDESAVGIREVDPLGRTLRFASPTGHPPGAFGITSYVVWNTRKGLTRPGQWFLDRRARRLYVRPLPGETPANFRATLGLTESLIRVEDVTGVTVRGLTLRGSDAPLRAGGFAAGAYDGAVTASKAPDFRCENLTIEAVAGWGIRAWNVPRAVVSRCLVRNVGAGGIRLEGAESEISDCTVRGVGQQYPSAVGLWTGGERARVRHNEVTDTSYTAILGAGKGTVIEANRIARAMQVLHDGGGIYVGFTQDVVIRGNLATEIVDNGGYGVSAYYLDENAENCLVEGNVSIGIDRPSQNHMARRNTLRRNLFVTSGELRLEFARCAGYTLEDNVLVGGKGILVRTPDGGITSLRGNRWSPGTGLVQRSVLADYNPLSTARWTDVVSEAARWTERGGRVFGVTLPGAPDTRVPPWDLRAVGPRPAR